MEFYSKISHEIEQLKQSDAFRFLKTEGVLDIDNIDFSSNDYLGIGRDKLLLDQFFKEQTSLKLTASSSRLISGNHKQYDKIESNLADLYSAEAALFFNSGFQLNIGLLPSITGKNDLILADKLVHASIIEGLRLSPAKVIRYKHLDYLQLESLLQKYSQDYENIFIVSESVFSMDGDTVDLSKLIALKNEYKSYLYLDEAHAVGAVGEKGLGCSEFENQMSQVDFLVGTMGKALSSFGAYVICSSDVKEYLVNKCKALIYSTALPPINVAWSNYILNQLDHYKAQRVSLKSKSEYLKKILLEHGVELIGDTHILAIVVGENKACMLLAEYLGDHGIKVQAIRPPTVPKGTSRIRISINDKLSFIDLDKFANIIISGLRINEK